MIKRLIISVLFFACLVHAQVAAPPQAAPFSSLKEAEHALLKGQIVSVKNLGTGVTNPQKMWLKLGDTEFKAVFKTVNDRRAGVTRLQQSSEVDFKDCWMFEIAAYELDKILGLEMIPPTVARTYKGNKGSLQLWIENAMTEKDRRLKNLSDPDKERWNNQIFRVRIFDNLIYNSDRNSGNILITDDWRVYMIDHSRCFKSVNILKAESDLKRFPKSVVEGLGRLNEDILAECCKSYLTGIERKTILMRRDLILTHYGELLKANGDTIHIP